MQWLFQEFDDTRGLADALERLGIAFSWHRVVPFVGDLIPEPDIADPQSVVMFGSYTLWRYADAHGLQPGVFKLKPFVHEKAWHPYLLNGADALFVQLRDIPDRLPDDGREWFMRPVEDGKEEPGSVRSSREILRLAAQVLDLDEDETPEGSLLHDTSLMLTPPVRILQEWRIWVVGGEIVSYSLYREGARVVYKRTIDDDALEFARQIVDINPAYSPAYVLDICRADSGLKLLETNCINAAGFYAADVEKIAAAIDGLSAT